MLTRALFGLVMICGTAATAVAQETKVVALGITDHKTTIEELQTGETPPKPKFNTPGVAYALVAHARKGDSIEVTLMKDGKPLMSNSRALEADEPGVLVQAGKSGVPAGGWPDGAYGAHVKITRDGKDLAVQESQAAPFE
ncbi:MAG: hypothetical protein ACRECX_04170 [Methyloceanibacter sp.]|uniref:hypothetical protein n=1 Tax=Methyloceanibacter sp. TaxID=1965321 RepID=UPI003D6D2ABA